MRSYTVKSGDTLSKIAGAMLGSESLYTKIAALNNISNPNLIFPGQVLQIPDLPQGLVDSSTMVSPKPSNSGIVSPAKAVTSTTAPAGSATKWVIWAGGTILAAILAAVAYKRAKAAKKKAA